MLKLPYLIYLQAFSPPTSNSAAVSGTTSAADELKNGGLSPKICADDRYSQRFSPYTSMAGTDSI